MTLKLYRAQRRRVERLSNRSRDTEVKQRCRIVLAIADGVSPTQINKVLGAARSTVYRVIGRFQDQGEATLHSYRHLVPPRKITERYVARLEEIVQRNVPKDFGWQRSTWTTELLARQLEEDTGILVHRGTVGRLLHEAGMRWGRPRPTPLRYTTKSVKTRKANAIKRAISDLGPDEVALYADEVDVHLNPKLGPCWMPRGRQLEVETPGKNEKRYVFGGLNPKTGHIVWLSSTRKNSGVFIEWLKKVVSSYRRYRVIHVVCDNYIIHKSKKTLAAVKRLGKIRLHFLPPYAPEHNPIERLWGDLHANITRNHRCKTMTKLMAEVEGFMVAAIPYPGARPSLARSVQV